MLGLGAEGGAFGRDRDTGGQWVRVIWGVPAPSCPRVPCPVPSVPPEPSKGRQQPGGLGRGWGSPVPPGVCRKLRKVNSQLAPPPPRLA